MNCQQLAEQLQTLEPVAGPSAIARMCLLITNSVDSLEHLATSDKLIRVWRDTSLKIQAATDQHAAMTEELERLAQSDPDKFTKDQIWILIRAIKVQSQILQMYLGEPALDV